MSMKRLVCPPCSPMLQRKYCRLELCGLRYTTLKGTIVSRKVTVASSTANIQLKISATAKARGSQDQGFRPKNSTQKRNHPERTSLKIVNPQLIKGVQKD
eukprot:1572097-Amphidinium_carterae.3